MKNEDEELFKIIAPFQSIKKIAKGGMGEIFLVYDPICKRNIALKKIRPDLCKNPLLVDRFLKEATLTAQLTHPSILPIYSIHKEGSHIFYTMPYIEGETLNSLLQRAKKSFQTQGIFPKEASISSLLRIYLQILEAMAYAHSKNLLHRDLKPENIMIGKYGEVIILDWGIAQFVEQEENPSELGEENGSKLTLPGKLAGTLTFMAPERVKGTPASFRTDIYALGIILYKILTFSLPFQRTNIKIFKKFGDQEELIDPIEKSPARDIPHQLSLICKKCLAKEPEKRFQTVEELLSEIKDFIEGHPEWIFLKELSTHKKSDWKFQESIFLAKHTAITQETDYVRWLNMMISKSSFSQNLKIETSITFKKECKGIGFLFNVPEKEDPQKGHEGFWLWIGSPDHPLLQFYRNRILIEEIKKFPIERKESYDIRLEQFDHLFRFFLDNKLVLTYQSHLPTSGTHVGVFSQDGDFQLSPLKMFSGSYRVMISCLAVGDAFFTKKDFDTAYLEYRKISASFSGRPEGREAIFRAGITLLEKAKMTQDRSYYFQALEEFEKLHSTAGAPLEYLGKSMVYALLDEAEEESKCLELALRKFPRHPLRFLLEEQIIQRSLESALKHREATYRLMGIGMRYITHFLDNSDTFSLWETIQKTFDDFFFFEKPTRKNSSSKNLFLIEIIYRLGRKHLLAEILHHHLTHKDLSTLELYNLCFALLDLKEYRVISEVISHLKKDKGSNLLDLQWLELAAEVEQKGLGASIKKLMRSLYPNMSFLQHRVLLFIIQCALDQKELIYLSALFEKCSKIPFPQEVKKYLDHQEIIFSLLSKDLSRAKNVFQNYPKEKILSESSLFFSSYVSWLTLAKKNQYVEKLLFSLPDVKHPQIYALLARYLGKKLSYKWFKQSLFTEKKELLRQLTIHACSEEDEVKEEKYRKMLLCHDFQFFPSEEEFSSLHEKTNFSNILSLDGVR